MTYYTLRLCSSRGAFEAVPDPSEASTSRRIRARLEAGGISVVDARVMLIAQMEREVTFGRDGRVLIKSQDPEEAQRVFDSLRSLLEAPADPTPS